MFSFKKAAAATAIILSILAVVLAGLAWNQIYRTATMMGAYTKKLQSLQTTLSSFEKQLNVLQSKPDRSPNIAEKAHNQRILSEVSYLVHGANWQLIVSHNPESALQTMKQANEQLKEITDPDLTPLKQSIEKDIVSLENVPKLDIEKLLADLNQVKVEIQKLPSLPIAKPSTTPTNDNQTKNLSWSKKLERALSEIKSLIIIRHEEKPIMPLLSSEQLMFLKENAQLKISAAEWAVLYRNIMVYQESLKNAKQMLEEYYPIPSAVAPILKEIQSLSEMNIQPQLPNFSDTLKILSNTLEGKKQ